MATQTAANSNAHPTPIAVDAFVLAREQKVFANNHSLMYPQEIYVKHRGFTTAGSELVCKRRDGGIRLFLLSSPDIPPVVTVFNIECVDWTDAQIGNNDCGDDIKNVDLSCIHNMSGLIAVEGAEPGDCLVDILDAIRQDAIGLHCHWCTLAISEHFTNSKQGIFELENVGGLFAREFQSRAAKAIWDFEGIYVTSRHIFGVRFAGVSHPGLIGTAPSNELLATWNKREGALIEAHANAIPPVAYGPLVQGAYVGQEIPDEVREKIYREGAQAVSGRKRGGNCDIKNLSKGSRCYFPVFVKGAKLSVGDLHFSQGDLSFCGAIDMVRQSSVFYLSLIVGHVEFSGWNHQFQNWHHQGGIEKFALKHPIFLVRQYVFEFLTHVVSSPYLLFQPSPVDPQYPAKLVFGGISVDYHGDGQQYNMDATVAYKQAALNAIAVLP
ncbi:hypothetical protein PAXRUDRAFT_13497 [Paxillus rubicundulus Ve08.2h10]|uniref:Formamidase n=1 Tax=Paxillus rubicundulus Ve08.2h10 TaxID=930991 RepID=A0A0D0DTN6_9AGAM|nr:hypothetical protein PAXRUDRAFT_13497 [Paxillus rubicundulus Ve08.2h10]